MRLANPMRLASIDNMQHWPEGREGQLHIHIYIQEYKFVQIFGGQISNTYQNTYSKLKFLTPNK